MRCGFFKNLNKILKNTKNFHIIGCLNSINQKEFPAGFFDKHQNFKFKKTIRSKKVRSLTKVDWVKGYSLIINLRKFRNPKIFDKSYFLYLEEIDLCKSVLKRSGNIYFSHDLKIKHLGAKGSTARSTEEKRIRKFKKLALYVVIFLFFIKKHYGYFFAVKQLGGKLFRSLIKLLFFLIFFQKVKKRQIFI